jgi:hypothetical protein
MNTKQVFCSHLDMIVGILTIIVLISELMPFASKYKSITHMLYTSFNKKQVKQDIEAPASIEMLDYKE